MTFIVQFSSVRIHSWEGICNCCWSGSIWRGILELDFLMIFLATSNERFQLIFQQSQFLRWASSWRTPLPSSRWSSFLHRCGIGSGMEVRWRDFFETISSIHRYVYIYIYVYPYISYLPHVYFIYFPQTSMFFPGILEVWVSEALKKYEASFSKEAPKAPTPEAPREPWTNCRLRCSGQVQPVPLKWRSNPTVLIY